MKPQVAPFLGAYVILVLGACATPVTGPPEPQASRTVTWRLEIGNRSGASFGVRILLDGDSVYEYAAAAQQGHTVEVVRPYVSGAHLVEFEILAATSSPSTYSAAWTVRVTPTGPFFHADGVPTSLAIGERLKVTVPL